jgi:hypothetical protein
VIRKILSMGVSIRQLSRITGVGREVLRRAILN